MKYSISSQSPLTCVYENLEMAVMRVLTATMSALDHEMDAHAHRTAQLAEATARQLGRTEEEQYLVRLAALVHDIGKIGVPEAIRQKPGPLTADEWAIMRLHPQIGQQILEQAGGVFRTLAVLVGAHHERWDGKGYPLELAGEEIPMGARILAVVDSYDAMISCRPYREPLSLVQARTELQRGAGSQYDPRVVNAFLHVLDEQKYKAEHHTEIPGEVCIATKYFSCSIT